MKVPLSWLKEYVDIDITPEELAHKLTFAGLEVEGLLYVGLAPADANIDGLPADSKKHHQGPKAAGLAWQPDKIVVADLLEVEPHPNADRLVLGQVDDGHEIHTVLTGAPNLFEYKGQGRLDPPLKIAYAKEGAQLYDGHKNEPTLMKLKRTKIRGVESYSMACSEKELGISEEHEGVIIFPAEAPAAGTPLRDYIGDVVLDVKINPNMARNANIIGIAREIAAITGAKLRQPSYAALAEGEPIDGQATIEIRNPDLNPRFTLTLIKGVTIRPSPFQMQLRLRLAGMRPISNIVDITNYVMLETGQPLHAFDYDVLVARAAGKPPAIITRLPEPRERLTTLDDIDRKLDDFTILVTDTAGVLSLGGIMGGGESEVHQHTTNVLLEAAAWNFINIRRSVQAQQLQSSQAGYRFSRGVHPAVASRANWRAIELMRKLGDGTICRGIVDEYPQPYPAAPVTLPLSEVARALGITIPKATIIEILESLEFSVTDNGDSLAVVAPDFRMDIGTGTTGIAGLVEEIARTYGYENIPETQISDTTPPQHGNPSLELEERVRDLLVNAGLQETISYRLTTPKREARLLPPGATTDNRPYVTLANPIAVERVAMRHSILASLLENATHNARFNDRIVLFEIGAIYLPQDGELLPQEQARLAIVMSGPRESLSWQSGAARAIDFYDLKGVIDEMTRGLHLPDVSIAAAEHPSFRPGRTARLSIGKTEVGLFGELHPLVRENYKLGADYPALAADINLETLLAAIPDRFISDAVSRFPPVVEDIALIVDRRLPAGEVEALVRQTGGKLLVGAQLFDVFEGEQIGAGKKSLAYRLTYQADNRTLTDKDAARIRTKIVKRLEREVGAVLREA